MTDLENIEYSHGTDKRTVHIQLNNIVSELVQRRKQCYSQQEVADMLEVDRRKIIALESGERFDIYLLEDYAGLLGKELLIIDQDLK